MRIWTNLLNKIGYHQYNRIESPRTERNELFGRTGWGPSQNALMFKPHRYHGPLYPAPIGIAGHPLPPASITQCNQARRAWSEGRFGEAEQAYDDAMSLAPQNPDFAFEKSQLLWCEQRFDDALSMIERSLSLDPRQAHVLVSKLRLAVKKRDQKTALETLALVNETSPSSIAPTNRAAAREIRRTLFAMSN